MRRCHLRGQENILKRQLIHVGAFNLSLILRKLLGAGTPREWKSRFGLHDYRLDSAVLQPACHPLEVGCEAAETLYRCLSLQAPLSTDRPVARENEYLSYSRCLSAQA